jgi:hypothetical protein
MFTVEYGYYNYPRKTKTFDNYASAKSFFYAIGKQNGVRRVELKEV